MDAARNLAGAFTDLLNVARPGSDEVCYPSVIVAGTDFPLHLHSKGHFPLGFELDSWFSLNLLIPEGTFADK